MTVDPNPPVQNVRLADGESAPTNARVEDDAQPTSDPSPAPLGPIMVSRAAVRAHRDDLRRGLDTLEAARETAAVEAARSHNEVVALLLQVGGTASNLPDKSRFDALRDFTAWLRHAGRRGSALVSDRRRNPAPPMLAWEDYDPIALQIDALDRLEHLPRHHAETVAALNALDEYLASITDDAPAALPTPIASAFFLEFSLRGAPTRPRLDGFAADFWTRVRNELAQLTPWLADAWPAFPPPPDQSLGTWFNNGVEHPASWAGGQSTAFWNTPRPARPKGVDRLVLHQSERFQEGEPLRALLAAFQEADQILRVLSEGLPEAHVLDRLYPDTPRSIPSAPFERYRDALGEQITAPFARGVAERAAASDLDGVLDALEVLHALPLRVPAMARLRESVAARFPEPGPEAPVDARLRARRFRALAGPPSPPTLPAAPAAPPSQQAAELGAPTLTIDAGVEVVGLALDRDGRRLAVLRTGETDRVYALPSAQVVGEFDSFAGNVAGSLAGRNVLAFSPDDTRLAAGSVSDTVRLFDTSDWSLVRDLQPEARKHIATLAFAPGDGALLIGQGGRMRFYAADGAPLGGETPPHDDLLGRITRFSADGRLALLEGPAQQALNLPARRSALLFGTLSAVHGLDGTFRHAIVGRTNWSAALVDLRGPDPLRMLDRSHSLAVASSTDGRTLVHGSVYRAQKYSDPKKRLLVRRAPNWDVVSQVGVADLGRVLEDRPLAGGAEIILVMENGVVVVDTETFRARALRVPSYIQRHALSADGRTLAIVDKREKTVIKIWQLGSEAGSAR